MRFLLACSHGSVGLPEKQVQARTNRLRQFAHVFVTSVGSIEQPPCEISLFQNVGVDGGQVP